MSDETRSAPRPVLSFGEILIDFIVTDGSPSLDAANEFVARSGGAPANVTVALARLGLPSAFCGVVGLKPTYGRVSRYGLVAYGSSLDQIGPIVADARDAALVLGVISGADPADTTSIRAEVPDYLGAIEEPLEGLRIGLPREFYGGALDPEIAGSIRRAAKLMEAQGAVLTEVDLPHSRIDIDPSGDLSSYATARSYDQATRQDAVAGRVLQHSGLVRLLLPHHQVRAPHLL